MYKKEDKHLFDLTLLELEMSIENCNRNVIRMIILGPYIGLIKNQSFQK